RVARDFRRVLIVLVILFAAVLGRQEYKIYQIQKEAEATQKRVEELQKIQADLEALKSLPAGTLLDDTNSIVFVTLPQQFADQYDAAFLTRMETELLLFRERARRGESMAAHSVMEELLLYLCVGETISHLETTGEIVVCGGKKITPSYDWLYDLFDDMDIVTCLYSDITLPENHLYHLCHWDDKVFYTKEVCL
ncbi:MAG: hypothetical protein J6Y48_20530, partial [Clostridia bacterium]|nr:hypothetical protein [Clostridia bacterium]